jgi:peptidoglycan/xylan/chitin deacetylase (PgdA/CDA1 family)
MKIGNPGSLNYHLPILAYHKVDLKKELGITSISPKKFERQINFLKQNGYISISPLSLLNQINPPLLSEGVSPIRPYKREERYVLITFDDGYEGVYEYAYPILKRYGWTATIFLTTGYIGSYNKWDASPGPRFKHLNWQQIKAMSDNGICFGSHGINHLFLTKHSDETIRYELETSKKIIEDKLGKPVLFFSYPYNNYNKRLIELVSETGYKLAFSLKPEILSADYFTCPYELPRFAIYCIDGMKAFKAKIGESNGSLIHIQKLKNQLINRCSYAGVIFEKFRL